MSPVGFEPTISAGERVQICALNRSATGTGEIKLLIILYSNGLQICLITGKINDMRYIFSERNSIM